MAVPKRKYPKAHKLKRRSHDHLTKSPVVSCEQCRQPKLNHRVCPNCGTYRGRTVIDMEKSKP